MGVWGVEALKNNKIMSVDYSLIYITRLYGVGDYVLHTSEKSILVAYTNVDYVGWKLVRTKFTMGWKRSLDLETLCMQNKPLPHSTSSTM